MSVPSRETLRMSVVGIGGLTSHAMGIGGLVDDAQVRRHGPGPRDLEAVCRVDGWDHGRAVPGEPSIPRRYKNVTETRTLLYSSNPNPAIHHRKPQTPNAVWNIFVQSDFSRPNPEPLT